MQEVFCGSMDNFYIFVLVNEVKKNKLPFLGFLAVFANIFVHTLDLGVTFN